VYGEVRGIVWEGVVYIKVLRVVTFRGRGTGEDRFICEGGELIFGRGHVSRINTYGEQCIQVVQVWYTHYKEGERSELSLHTPKCTFTKTKIPPEFIILVKGVYSCTAHWRNCGQCTCSAIAL
jgi:hypothetical protein